MPDYFCNCQTLIVKIREMPSWKFLMAYDGLFTRPAGLIHSSFSVRVLPGTSGPPEAERR